MHEIQSLRDLLANRGRGSDRFASLVERLGAKDYGNGRADKSGKGNKTAPSEKQGRNPIDRPQGLTPAAPPPVASPQTPPEAEGPTPIIPRDPPPTDLPVFAPFPIPEGPVPIDPGDGTGRPLPPIQRGPTPSAPVPEGGPSQPPVAKDPTPLIPRDPPPTDLPVMAPFPIPQGPIPIDPGDGTGRPLPPILRGPTHNPSPKQKGDDQPSGPAPGVPVDAPTPAGEPDLNGFSTEFSLAPNSAGADTLSIQGDTATLTGPDTNFTFTGVDASGIAADGPITATGGSGTINGVETTAAPLSSFGPAVLNVNLAQVSGGSTGISAAFANGERLNTTGS